jgi:RNA 3'-terminal phosphate cyclase (ATP)
MIYIDGSQGEGGGQVLRSALTLAIISGKAVHIDRIRARRPKPGLMAQHLQAVRAAAAVSEAHVEGGKPGSTSLSFEPRRIVSGRFHFEIGTAGSTSLVLQTIVVPLSLAGGISQIRVRGGTHVPWSPSFHYLQRHWLPFMREIGFDFDLVLGAAGFYPQGGGVIHCEVRPARRLAALTITERGACRRIHGISAVARLDPRIAERQRSRAIERLKPVGVPIDITVEELPAGSPGTMLLLAVEFEASRWCFCSLGARGKPAERVADEAIDAFFAFQATDAAVDSFLADQLIIPLALADGVSTLRTAGITQHLVTNVDVVRAFLPVDIAIEGAVGQPGTVRIRGIETGG